MASIEVREYRGILFFDTPLGSADSKLPGLTRKPCKDRGVEETKYTLVGTDAHLVASPEARRLLISWRVAEDDSTGSLLWRRNAQGIWELTWYGGEGTMFTPWGEPFRLGTKIDESAFKPVDLSNAPDWDRELYGDAAWAEHEKEGAKHA